MPSNIANHVKKYIKEKEISVRELERLAGLTTGTVTNIIHGKSQIPTHRTLMGICDVLGCTRDELMGPIQDENSPYLDSKVTWDPELFIECAQATINLFTKLAKQPMPKIAIAAIQEIYMYSAGKEDTTGKKTADTSFAAWYISKHFS